MTKLVVELPSGKLVPAEAIGAAAEDIVLLYMGYGFSDWYEARKSVRDNVSEGEWYNGIPMNLSSKDIDFIMDLAEKAAKSSNLGAVAKQYNKSAMSMQRYVNSKSKKGSVKSPKSTTATKMK